MTARQNPPKTRSLSEAEERSGGGLFDLVFWVAVFAAGALFVQVVLAPGFADAEKAGADLATARERLEEKKARLERKRAHIRALIGPAVNIDTLERELRRGYNWKEPGETVIPLD